MRCCSADAARAETGQRRLSCPRLPPKVVPRRLSVDLRCKRFHGDCDEPRAVGNSTDDGLETLVGRNPDWPQWRRSQSRSATGGNRTVPLGITVADDCRKPCFERFAAPHPSRGRGRNSPSPRGARVDRRSPPNRELATRLPSSVAAPTPPPQSCPPAPRPPPRTEGGLGMGQQVRTPRFPNCSVSKGPRLHQPRLLRRDPLQQFRRRFVVRVLRHQLAAHGQIENEAAQPRDRVGRVGDALVVREQAFGVHRASASARIAFNWSRRLAVSASAALSFGQQFLRVAVVVGHRVRVLDVEVVAARLHLLGRHLPRLRRLLAAFALRPPHQSMQPCRCSKRIGFVIE